MVRTDHPHSSRRLRHRFGTVALVALAAAAAVVAVAGISSAHGGTPHGELTFHDSEDGPATDTVECEFWIRGHNVTSSNGTIEWRHQLRSSDSHEHALTNWTSEDVQESENGSWDFELGPLTIHDHDSRKGTRVVGDTAARHNTQHYYIEHTDCEEGNETETENGQEPLPGDRSDPCDGPQNVQAYHDGLDIVVHWDRQADADGYVVNRSEAGERDFTTIAETEDETSYTDTSVETGVTYTYVVTVVDDEGDPGTPCDHVQITARDTRPPPCPNDVQAQAQEGGAIELAWSGSAQADAYKIYRATGNDSFGKLNSVQDPGYVDENTEEDQTYRYRVVGASEDGESKDCPIVEATAIPTFPSAVALGAAVLGSLAVLGVAYRER